jgi:hypothetical protein
MASTRSWDEVKREIPLNPSRMAAYRALLEADMLLEPVLLARERRRRDRERAAPALAATDHQGQLADALARVEATADGGEPGLGLYLEALARYLGELGGQLELKAVFDEGAVTLLRMPAASAGGGGEPTLAQPESAVRD